jgi:hypothetical protein
MDCRTQNHVVVNEKQAQAILPMSLAWFRKKRLRTESDGPRFLKIGSRVFYRVSELYSYIAERDRGGK